MPLYSQSKMPSMGTKVIAVRVGREPNHIDLTVHEDLIRASSEFFQAALGRPWRESQERIVRLPECDATAFKIYSHWLYSGLLCAIPTGASSSIGVSSSLVRGYLLGDYLQDANYRDTTIDGLIEWNKDAETAQRTSFLSSWIGIADDQTGKGSPLQKLLIDMTVWDTAHAWWTSVIAKVPANFIQDVCIGFSARCRISSAANPLRNGGNRCAYHSHGDKSCYVTEETRVPPMPTSSSSLVLSPPRRSRRPDGEKRPVGDYCASPTVKSSTWMGSRHNAARKPTT